jgi:excisionase family DNA binding protein
MLTRMETLTLSPVPFIPRLAYSIAESEVLSGLSRSSLYRLMAAGKLKTIQRGRRRLVPAQELHKLVTDEAGASLPNSPGLDRV